MKTYIIGILTSFTIITGLKSQPDKFTIGRGSLENQFNYVIYRGEKVDNSRIVKSWWLYTLKNQVGDTLDYLHSEIGGLNDTIGLLSNNISALQQNVDELENKIDKLTKEKESIEVAGLVLQKNLYNTIVWSIIGALILLVGILFIMFKRSHVVTRESRQDLAEIKEEFEAFRKRALEREREVVRKLYDEVLKYKNMVGSD